ncbi:MAG: XrtA-associated tyrosine autokinase [Gammaproteobacteria bacterium]|nr:XrtA-associated tyrosine autokinase [Gammaproteobacteria bacterium]NND61535.1 AAA family ATPase [Gammaproteobacteria bacterium]
MSIVEKAVDKHRRLEPQLREQKRARQQSDDAKVMAPALPNRDADSAEVVLDLELLAREGINPDGANSISEEFRRLKRPLLDAVFRDEESVEQASDGPRRNLLLISSALSGEGKTFTALNLALSIAHERDRTVVLIDADVAKPHVSRLLGIEERPGLLDLLKDDTLDVSEVLLQTDIDSLKVIPAGQRDEFATELLASKRMISIARELADRYPDRIILFDSPPLLQTAEAQVLAGVMGQVLVVVHAGQTPQAAVSAATELLGETPAQLVLNKSRSSTRTDYNGYYGSYY